MNHPRLTELLLSVFLLLRSFAAAADLPSLRLQSVESFYTRSEGEVCCTLCLHVRAAEGTSFSVREGDDVPASTPLIGTDAAGRIMLGKFRCVESCMEDCRTLVFDFYTRPQGGWIEFDTVLTLRLLSTDFIAWTAPFDPRRTSTLRALNRSFFVSPLDAQNSDGLLLRMDYEMSPLIRGIAFIGTDGKLCRSRVLDAVYNEKDGLTSTTYLLEGSKTEAIRVRLLLRHPPTPCRVPVRMRIYPGIITDPGI